jgi:hypothetical protein
MDSIKIFGGNFNLWTKTEAGIGTGHGRYSQTLRSIAIMGGNFTIVTSNGSGIGSGVALNGTQSVGSVVIDGGHFVIRTERGAGIGSGYSTAGVNTVENVTIRGGTFSISTREGAAIGSGAATIGSTTVEHIQISDAVFNISLAGGDNGTGIGSGGVASGISRVKELSFTNATIDIYAAPGGTGIGAGPAVEALGSSVVDSLLLRDVRVRVDGSDSGPCFGANPAVGRSEVVDFTIEDADLICGHNGVEAGGLGTDSGSSRVTALNVRRTTIACQSRSGICLGGEILEVLFDTARVRCEAIDAPECVRAQHVIIPNYFDGKTATVVFFRAGDVESLEETPIVIRYLNRSEPEELNYPSVVSFTGLHFPWPGEYSIVLHTGKKEVSVSMEGDERGLLVTLPGREQFRATFTTGSGVSIGGAILTEARQPIVLREGITVVANPVFFQATACFTEGATAYSLRRVFVALTVFMIAEVPELEVF